MPATLLSYKVSKKNGALAYCHSRANALFSLGHPVVVELATIGRVNISSDISIVHTVL